MGQQTKVSLTRKFNPGGLQRPTVVTLVTSRNSDASYLNRVELQNGCLALAHANLFIPSNVHGTCSPLSMQL